MYFVHPGDTERFALRMLLLYRKGCSSFQQLRTVNSITYESFKETCIALGYARDDNESKICLEEASTFSTAFQMRELFVLILLNCCPSNPRQLWDSFKDEMAHDFLIEYRAKSNNEELQFNETIYNEALICINNSLHKSGNELANYSNMPEIIHQNNNNNFDNRPNIIKDELSYDINALRADLDNGLNKLNPEQRIIFETITNRVNNFDQIGNNAFFIDGPGGTGKTFVYKMILASIRSNKKIALAVASSGIAAQLLQGARTGHSRCKIPINLTSTSTCNIRVQSDDAKLLQETELILWDECPMMHRHAFEALDRTLRDVMGQINPIFREIPFGNKLIVFGGDFRQILPVVKKGTKNDIIKASFNRSKLWPNITVLKLKINMRVQRLAGNDQIEAKKFADFLIRIGEGTEPTFT